MENGYVFDIQHFSINNGPGIRTTAFLKGCPLRCVWCHNPESFQSKPQIRYLEKICKHCGACIKTCKNNALYIKNGKINKHLERCTSCGHCVNACNYGAMSFWGKKMSSDEVVDELLKDNSFYHTSNGGVTISGGEPTFQYNFLCEILTKLREKNIHIAIDTNGYCEEKKFLHILELADHILFDLKHISSNGHKQCTGTDNEIILNNFNLLINSKCNFNIRFPMIPGYNDSENNIQNLCSLLKENQIFTIDISIFHDYYTEKYTQLFQTDKTPYIPHYTQDELEKKLNLFQKNGIKGVII